MIKTYEELEAAAKKARAERILAVKKVSSIRRKPRTPEEREALKRRFKAILEKYPPRYENGVLILPFFPVKPFHHLIGCFHG